MSKDALDYHVLTEHLGIIKGYLMGMAAPIEVMNSLRTLSEQFVVVGDDNQPGLARLDKMIEDAIGDNSESRGKKRQAWSAKEKDEVWHKRFTEKKKPGEIAEDYPGRDGPAVSNLIQQMKNSGYKPSANA